MKKLIFVTKNELAVVNAIREIDAIETERHEYVNLYDKYIRSNGFRNFAEAVNYVPSDESDEKSKRIDEYEKKLWELDNKIKLMKSKIGLYL